MSTSPTMEVFDNEATIGELVPDKPVAFMLAFDPQGNYQLVMPPGARACEPECPEIVDVKCASIVICRTGVDILCIKVPDGHGGWRWAC